MKPFIKNFNNNLTPKIIREDYIKKNLYNSLDLLKDTKYLDITKFNKNIINEDLNISNNKVKNNGDDTVSEIFIPNDKYIKPQPYFNNYVGNGKINIIKEYICNISSIDRDIIKYPNPFNFLVRFQGLPENNDATIQHMFNNIKSFKIDNIILPRRYYIYKEIVPNEDAILNLFNNEILNNQKVEKSTDEWWVVIYFNSAKQIINYTNYISSPNILENCYFYETIKLSNNNFITYRYSLVDNLLDYDKYLLIFINDINNINEFSTNKNLSTAFNILFPDMTSKYYLYSDNRSIGKTYEISNLGSINRLLIDFKDSLGRNLTINIKTLDFDVPNINDTMCTCTYDEFNNIVRNYSCICNYIRHPRYIKNQIEIMFKFEIIECDFNKKIFN